MTAAATETLFATDSIGAADRRASFGLVEDDAERQALGLLFNDHSKGIFRVAYRITGSQSDAEDVLQTIFFTTYAGLDGTKSRAKPTSIPLSGGNQCISRHRQATTADTQSHSKPWISIKTQNNRWLRLRDNFSDLELRELVRQAVAKLEGRAATAFALRYYEGYDNGQIAEVLGTSQTVVAVTLHRARARLRKEIGSYLEKHHEE